MFQPFTRHQSPKLGLALALCLGFSSATASELDPKAISIKLPEQINWVANPSGSESAVLVGDPAKPGLYVVTNGRPITIASRIRILTTVLSR